jgi:hypothetical protein
MLTDPHPLSAAADPIDRERFLRGVVEADGWLAAAGLSAADWPLSTEQAVAVLRTGGGFEVDQDGVFDLVSRGLLAAPAKDVTGWEWGGEDVVRAAGVLIARRQWMVGCNDHLKHYPELLLERAGAEHVLSCAPVRFDVRCLLTTLVAADGLDERVKAGVLLMAVLEAEHGVKA